MSDVGHAVLCIDDEENILSALKRLLRKEDYRLLTASSAKDGLQILRTEKIHLVICDQRMPEMNGEFLAKMMEEFPNVIRIVLTGYTDVDSITESINKGHIFKFLLKPWNDNGLKLEIRQALEQYDLVQANRRLNEQVLEKNRELASMNEDLERKVKERTRELELQNHALELARAVFEDLPVPIIGVGRDGVIVIMNRGARDLPVHQNPPGIGKKLKSCFSIGLYEKIDEVFAGLQYAVLSGYGMGHLMFNIHIKPLTGSFLGKGVVLAFINHSRTNDSTRSASERCDDPQAHLLVPDLPRSG